MKIVSSREVYKSPIFRVTEDEATDPSGFEIKRSIVQHMGSAVMLAVDEKHRILLVRQFRLPARKYLWELPAGRLDEGEKPLQAARRELREETGCQARQWKKLTAFWPSPGFVGEKMTIFVATDLTEGEAQPMEDERITSQWFKRRDIDEMIRKGEIEDGKTLIGYLMWMRYARKKAKK